LTVWRTGAVPGFRDSDIDATNRHGQLSNGVELQAGEATGDVNEAALRRIQIREAIRAHFEKEQVLFGQGIKVLSLFFIDEVAKYRQYDESGESPASMPRCLRKSTRLKCRRC
jgi:type III restriction enzyme